jgi:hypothetical protein
MRVARKGRWIGKLENYAGAERRLRVFILLFVGRGFVPEFRILDSR